jgi:hypothetical protein
MRAFFAGLLLGILSSTLIMFLFYRDTDVPVKDVTVTQVSGEKIEHSGFNYKAGTIKFSTHAAGKGEIVTEIPKINIPEARAWMQNNHAVMIELLLVEERNYGISYLRRWENFAVGGGVVVSEKNFEGVKVQAQYWFNIK